MNTLRNSQKLRRRIELVLPELKAAGSALHGHRRFVELYPEYLTALHGMIRASVPLMEAALSRCRATAADDTVATAIVPYLARHISEERHHDDWLLEDLEVLGVSKAHVLLRRPSATISEMVGAQYYWIFHYHPVALLGYIAVMEGYPPSPDQIDALVATTGHPLEAFRTLSKHAHLDPYHRDELDVIVDSLALSDHHMTVLGISAIQTARAAAAVFHEIVEVHSS